MSDIEKIYTEMTGNTDIQYVGGAYSEDYIRWLINCALEYFKQNKSQADSLERLLNKIAICKNDSCGGYDETANNNCSEMFDISECDFIEDED